MTNGGVQPMGRGEEARAGVGDTGWAGMEGQLHRTRTLDGVTHAGRCLTAQCLAPLWLWLL